VRFVFGKEALQDVEILESNCVVVVLLLLLLLLLLVVVVVVKV
jgi:hypothetical protein